VRVNRGPEFEYWICVDGDGAGVEDSAARGTCSCASAEGLEPGGEAGMVVHVRAGCFDDTSVAGRSLDFAIYIVSAGCGATVDLTYVQIGHSVS
jgi:hypothetical protein